MIKSKIMMILVGALLLCAGSAVAMTKLYLGKRDDLAQQRIATELATVRGDSYIAQLKEETVRRLAVEALRIDLTSQIIHLENQEVETITEIREVWRDREVIVNNPVAVECVGEPLPDSIISMLCQSDNRGACGNLQTST